MNSHLRSLVHLGPETLHALRASLETALGDDCAAVLQHAGFSGGDELYDAFGEWLDHNTDLDDPAELDAALLSEALSNFFAELGWGEINVERLGSSALALDAPAWAEASQNGGAVLPSCHLSTGLFAAFLGRLADRQVAVMEVECRSRGDTRCRFLVGASETLHAVFEAMSQGQVYESVLNPPGSGGG